MRIFLHRSAAFLFITGLLLGFNNCAPENSGSLFSSYVSSSCSGEECVQKNADLLDLTINHQGEIRVASTTSRLDIGGECNEGGYPVNSMVWEVYNENNPNSIVFGSLTNAAGVEFKCINGRFSTQVHLPTPVSMPLIVWIELIAFDDEGNEVRNTLQARKSVFVRPL